MVRILLLVCLAAAAGVLAWGNAARGNPLVPLGEVWFSVHVGSLNLAQAIIERYISERLWSGFAFVLQAPAVFVMLVLSGVLAFFFFRK